jgi:hypothetical protein
MMLKLVVKSRSDLTLIYTFFIYRAPWGNFTNSLLKFESILKLVMNPNTKFIICRDINIHCLVDTDRKSQLKSLPIL